MNRLMWTFGGVLSASSLLLMDAAIKGTVLLALAAIAALLLRRDSAATRHLVWMMAIVALLIVPVLSATLPQWRVLPNWMSSPRPSVAAVESSSVPTVAKTNGEVVEMPQRATSVLPVAPMEVDQSAAPDLPPAAPTQVSQPTMIAPREIPAQEVGASNWINAIPLVWTLGFVFLMLRLSAARWMLWSSERLAVVVGQQQDPQIAAVKRKEQKASQDPIFIAMTALSGQLKIRRPITLLIHPHKTIPVVWGIFRCRLMLPVAARQWSEEQLQSVLMHELAHIKRGDVLVQLLTQVACALHWFNPLVWFAAWRLDVERERSCDDLVLASGIRPSAYAAHLLDVVSGLSSARWTQACGLAMARKSSLEGRLTAVLGKNLNRRSVSASLAVVAMLIAVGIAVPIAMVRAAGEKWNPPQAAHISSNDFSVFCVHDGKEVAYITAYHGRSGSSTSGSSNAKLRTWNDNSTLTLLDTAEKRKFTLGRDHTAPNKLTLNGKDYDLAKGRVFLLADNGSIRQLDIATPPVTARDDADGFAKLIAKITPRPMKNRTGKLQPQTVAKLKWGEPVNGLRMALAFPPALKDPLLGDEEFYQLVVQNVSEKAVHYAAGDQVLNPRSMIYREGERIVQVLSDKDAQRADWKLAPGECGVLWLFTKEERNKEGKTISSLLDSDLPSDLRYHVVVSMEIAQAADGAWTGKLVTGEMRSSEAVAAPPTPMPHHKDARALYDIWQRYARANGDIPGGLIGELAAAVKQFIKYNPTWQTVPKLNELLPRLDATRDWKPADAIALLDEIASIQNSPLSMALDNDIDYVVRTGKPLPKELAEALGLWGPADEDGLRVAWDLQPRHDLQVEWAKHASVSSTAAFGEALKARLLVHNSGAKPIVVRVPTFLQCEVKADDQERKAVECQGIDWTTRSRLYTCRLAPGEFVEIMTPGIGFGKDAGRGPWAGPRVGWNVMTQPGDSVTLKHAPVPLDGSQSGRREDAPFAEGPDWWRVCIKARLGRELPLPEDATERARILERAANELFGSAPTADEREAFAKVADENSLSVFIAQLAKRPGLVSFFGKLQPVVTSFKIAAADANADKQPRVVLGPGEYPLHSTTATRGNATLKIVGRPVGDRRTNDAQLIFEATEFTGARPPDPHKLDVPDGWRTWAIVCRPSDGYFYLLHKGTVRKIDYSKPRNITDTPANDLPIEFRDEVKRQLDIHEISAAQQAEIFEKPAAPAAAPDSKTSENVPTKPSEAGTPKLPKLPDEDYTKTGVQWQKYHEEDAKGPGGELMSDIVWTQSRGDCPLEIGLRVAQDAKWNIGGQVRVEMVVRNLSGSDVKFSQSGRADNGLSVVAIDKDFKELVGEIAQFDAELGFNHLLLPRSHAVKVKSFMLRFDPDKRDVSEPQVAAFHLPPGDYTLRCKWNDAHPEVAHKGEWTGELVCDEHKFTLAVAAEPATLESGATVPQVMETEKPKSTATMLQPKAAKQEPLSTLATGQLELETKEPEKLPSEKETPTSPSNVAAVSEKPKPNYVRVIGQLLDDETGQPIEKAGWEWGMADPNKPDQISWGHSRSMGKSHPDGKFEMPLNISTNGNHFPLRVYAAGYETTVVVGELAKPYPEKIERNIRLKRGRSITGVLRDHTGNPVANGWVYFIPKGHQTNIVESIPGTDAHQLPAIARDGAVSEVRTNENGTFALPTGVAGTLAASTDLVDLWPFPLPDDGYAELKMPAPSYLVIDLTYWYLTELVKKGEHELSPNSEDPNQCWIHIDQSGSSEPLWKNLGYRRQMLVFAKDPRAKLSKGVIVGHVVEGEMDKPIPDIGHNKNLSTKIRVALPPGNYRVQRLRTGPFAPVDEQNVELKSGENTILSWARGDGSSVRGKATWPTNMMFVRQQGEAPRKLDWTVPYTATVWIAPVGADGKDGKPIDAAKIQADGSFFVPTNLDPGKYKATARVFLPESDDSRLSSGWRGPDCVATAEFIIPEPARGPFGSPPVELEIKMEVAENVRFLRSNALADPPQAMQPPAGKPKLGAMLKSATEQKLKWGEPVNGLRAALVMQPVPDEPDAEDKNDIFLVVQNVTKAEVWLHSSDAAPNPRQLIWRDKGVLETGKRSSQADPCRCPASAWRSGVLSYDSPAW